MKRLLFVISIICIAVNFLSAKENNFEKLIIGKWQMEGHECDINGICSTNVKTSKIIYNFGEFEIGSFKRRQLLVMEKNNANEGYYNIDNRTIRVYKSKDKAGRGNWAGEPIVIISIKDNTMLWYSLTHGSFQVLKRVK